MFGFIRLAIWGLAGYGLYELIQRNRQQGFGQPIGQGEREMEQATSGDQGRLGTLTGGGRGMTATTEEPSGMSAPHTVGRGVVE